MKLFTRYQTGSNDWNFDIIVSRGMVGVAFISPQNKNYDGEFLSPDEAEQIAEALLSAAKDARTKTDETVPA